MKFYSNLSIFNALSRYIRIILKEYQKDLEFTLLDGSVVFIRKLQKMLVQLERALEMLPKFYFYFLNLNKILPKSSKKIQNFKYFCDQNKLIVLKLLFFWSDFWVMILNTCDQKYHP